MRKKGKSDRRAERCKVYLLQLHTHLNALVCLERQTKGGESYRQTDRQTDKEGQERIFGKVSGTSLPVS